MPEVKRRATVEITVEVDEEKFFDYLETEKEVKNPFNVTQELLEYITETIHSNLQYDCEGWLVSSKIHVNKEV